MTFFHCLKIKKWTFIFRVFFFKCSSELHLNFRRTIFQLRSIRFCIHFFFRISREMFNYKFVTFVLTCLLYLKRIFQIWYYSIFFFKLKRLNSHFLFFFMFLFYTIPFLVAYEFAEKSLVYSCLLSFAYVCIISLNTGQYLH